MTRTSGSERLDRRRDPAGKPATADRDEDDGDVGQGLDDLEADRALAGDDPVVVVGRDDREAALRRDLLGDLLALVAGRPDGDDLRPVRGDPIALDGRRVGRHDDHRRHAEEPCRAGDALGVVPDEYEMTPRASASAGRDAIADVRPAELERADRLERLGLQEPAVLRTPVGDQRGLDGMPRRRSAAARMSSMVTSGALSVAVIAQRSRAPRRWQSMQRAAHGRASSRSGAIGRPHRTHRPEGPGVEPGERLVDELELAFGAVAQGEVTLLGEDLARRRGL